MKFLSQPYPLEQRASRKMLIAIAFGLFIFAFLYLFRPFGLHYMESDELTKASLHLGIICSALLAFNFLILPQIFTSLFDDVNWTIKKEILDILWNISTIFFINMFYVSFYLEYDFSTWKLLTCLFSTIAIVILPVSIYVLIKNMVLLKQNLRTAHVIAMGMHYKKRLTSTPDATLTIHAENKNEVFTILARDLLYITSSNDFIEIFYLEKGSVKIKQINATLKSARDDLRTFTAFYRCHREWIVNLDQVVSITGNAQGFRLILNHIETTIPISSNLNTEITNRLSK